MKKTTGSKIIAAIILFLSTCGVTQTSAQQFNASPGVAAPGIKDIAELNILLDRLLRNELFATLGGLKPITSTHQSLETFTTIAKAVTDGKINNPDVAFFWVNGEIALASRSALERLTKDTSVTGVMKAYSLPLPRNADDWIASFTRYCQPELKDSYESAVIQGITYGYPPTEVAAFESDNRSFNKQVVTALSGETSLLRSLKENGVRIPDSDNGWLMLKREAGMAVIAKKALPWQRQMFDISLRYKASPRQLVTYDTEGFSSPAYARFTGQELDRDGYYLHALYILTRNYDQLINTGHTPLEIINNPQWLKKDLPQFPAKYLTD